MCAFVKGEIAAEAMVDDVVAGRWLFAIPVKHIGWRLSKQKKEGDSHGTPKHHWKSQAVSPVPLAWLDGFPKISFHAPSPTTYIGTCKFSQETHITL